MERFGKANRIASIFVFVLFAVINLLAYFTYGDDLAGNLLKNLPQATW